MVEVASGDVPSVVDRAYPVVQACQAVSCSFRVSVVPLDEMVVHEAVRRVAEVLLAVSILGSCSVAVLSACWEVVLGY